MDLRRITDDYSVAPQITVQDISAIAGSGFRSIMCNRPDGEDAGQAAYDEIARAAKEQGLEVRCVPIVSSGISPQDRKDFDTALRELPKPLLAYCRSGTRCTMLWTMVQMGRLDGEEILQLTSKAGYDMSGIIGRTKQD